MGCRFRSRVRRTALLLACVAACAGTAGGASARVDSSGAHKSGTKTFDTIRFAIGTPLGQNLFDVGILYAADHGIFAKYHLTVKQTYLVGDPPALQALISGDADIADMSNPILYSAILQGAGIKSFFETVPSQSYLLVSNQSVSGIKGMEGKTLGTSGPGGIAEVLPFLAIRQAGVDTSKVHEVNAGGSSGRAAALIGGRIDAAIESVLDTVTLQRANPGKFKVLQNLGKTLPRFQFGTFAAKTSTLQSKRGVLIRFCRAMFEAQQKMASDRQAAINEYLKYNPHADAYALKQAYITYHKIGTFGLNGGMNPANFTFTVNALQDFKLLSGPLTFSQAYDTSIRDAAWKLYQAALKKKTTK